MGTSKSLASKKVLVKLSSKRLETAHGMRSCGLSHNGMPSESNGGKKLGVNFKEKSSMPRPHKRGAPDLMKYQVVKRRRSYRNLGSECSTTLKQKRTHPTGWVFNQPAFRQACLSEHLSVSQMSNPDLDSDGATSGLDNENSCLSSQHTPAATDAIAPQGCPIFDAQQSPKKALRAAMMKKRFAETILKAQKNTLFDHGKANPLKMQQEKERFKSIQCEEMIKIKAQMKKEEVDEVEAKLKRQRRRETEREAFRAALQKMTRTVDLEDNIWVQKEYDMMIGSSCSYDWPREVH